MNSCLMVLESQSLWKMGLVRRGNEKSLMPFGGGWGKGESQGRLGVAGGGSGWGSQLGEGCRVGGIQRFPQCWVNSLLHGPSLCKQGVGLL